MTTEDRITLSTFYEKYIDNAPLERFFEHFKMEGYDRRQYKRYEELVE
ncbi:hypothetical protein NP439_06675 [Oceanobacillus jeddahense]|uniref:Uncharacterized protein n=1 Tax=Oceanobacillus jeddahense TaxID=1462527 RepID=A0ABY5JW86_9BACI|nr:hypothetical protein [Oceanobacillus jeddahense]UUI04336.1 hypothetical protein NP439_06675 [Oceanobacillus jeddahense]